jgi:hypothetical protein
VKQESSSNSKGRRVRAKERKAAKKILQELGQEADKMRTEFKRKGFLSKREMKILNELAKPTNPWQKK